MNPTNTVPNQSTPEQPPAITPQPAIVQPLQAPPVIKSKDLIKKLKIGLVVTALLIIGGVMGVYVYMTIHSQAGVSNNSNVKTSDARTVDSSIKAKQNNSIAATNAQAVLSVAEVYNAEVGHYPSGAYDFKNAYEATKGVIKVPDGISVIKNSDGLNASNGIKTIAYECMDSCTQSKGGRVIYWDYTNYPGVKTYFVGDANENSTFVVSNN